MEKKPRYAVRTDLNTGHECCYDASIVDFKDLCEWSKEPTVIGEFRTFDHAVKVCYLLNEGEHDE